VTPESPEAVRIALQVIEVLDDLGVPCHVGGSFASSVHGLARHTQDIDLVAELPLGAVDGLVGRLGKDFYVDAEAARQAVRSRDCFNLIHRETAIKVDIFVRGDSAFDREEFARAVSVPGLGTMIRVKTAEDTLLRKLRWYRDGGDASDRQWNDALGVLRVQKDRLDRAYLERWAAELGIADLLRKLLESA
jgi:hypothetical protein